MKPIYLTRAQVAFAVEVTGWESFDQLSLGTGESKESLREMAERKIPPSQAVLNYFHLEQKGDSFSIDGIEPFLKVLMHEGWRSS